MLKLGTIGTGDIVHQFVKALIRQKSINWLRYIHGRYKLLKHLPVIMKCRLPHRYGWFLTSDIDIVYIASPNSSAFPTSKAAILAGKHVIVEKPAVSRPEEWAEW